MTPVIIYTLSDPRTNLIRYVGKTHNSLARRMQEHCAKKSGRRSHVKYWIESLLKIGLKPIAEEIETVDDSEWVEAERFWINYMRFLGCDLTNIEEGGNGGKSIPPEVRAKISASLTGRTGNNRGRKFSPEWCANISKGKMGNIPWNKGKTGLQVSYWKGKRLRPEMIAKGKATRLLKNAGGII